MPELPEVEITKKTLQKHVVDQTIQDLQIKNRNLRYKIDKEFKKKIVKKKIVNISRRSKYLVFLLSDGNYFIIHLGMSGRLLIANKKQKKFVDTSFYASHPAIKKHNHVYFLFKKKILIYNDTRRFGFIKYYNSKEFLNCQHLINLGVEPLSSECNFTYISNKIKKYNKSIKNVLMDQTCIAGLGNIYVNEALFLSKIHPERNSSRVGELELQKLLQSIKNILKKSISFGGSTIKDFHNSEGKIGSFQNYFRVYGRENEKCTRSRCGGMIKKITIGGRASFFCNICQQ